MISILNRYLYLYKIGLLGSISGLCQPSSQTYTFTNRDIIRGFVAGKWDGQAKESGI